MNINRLDMSIRTHNVLVRAGFKTLEEVKEFASKDIQWYKKINNLGPKSKKEVEYLFEKYLSDKVENIEPKWIPISDKLPPVGKCIIVTVKDHIRKQLELRYPVWYMHKTYENGYGFYFGEIGNILMPDISEVIAWMSIPKPYEPCDLDWSE